MGGCIAMSGLNVNCDDIKKIGGVQGDFWALNLKNDLGEKLQYTEDPTGKIITDIIVQSGSQAYLVEGEKYAHSWGHNRVKTELAKHYAQVVAIRQLAGNEDFLVWFDEFFTASGLVFIFETNEKRFVVLGQNNGLTGIEGDSFDSGTAADSDVTTTIDFTGEEVESPFKYFDTGGGYQANRDFLMGLLTPAP